MPSSMATSVEFEAAECLFGSSLLGTVSISDTRMLHPESIPSRTTNRVVRPGTGAATITLTPQANSAPFFVILCRIHTK